LQFCYFKVMLLQPFPNDEHDGDGDGLKNNLIHII